MSRKPILPRFCECGCNNEFRPRTRWQRYAKGHRQKAWEKNHPRKITPRKDTNGSRDLYLFGQPTEQKDRLRLLVQAARGIL